MMRNRLVIEQDGEQTVGTVLLTTDEIPAMLNLEAQIHKATGWHVERYGAMLRFTKGDTNRWVWVRSKPPLEDTLT